MNKPEKIIIIGNTAFAEIAYEYFTHDSDYDVVAFSVERDYIKSDTLFSKPVVPFETIESQYSPQEHSFFVAATYTQLNRLRKRLYLEAKSKGFTPASYISSNAFVWQNCQLGEHCFIFEDNVVQPFVNLGNNVILWSGNHIGHHSTIQDHCFVSSHVVVSGLCEIGESCFLGVNTTFNNNLKVAKDCLIGSGAVVIKHTEPGKVYVGSPARAIRSSYEVFDLKDA